MADIDLISSGYIHLWEPDFTSGATAVQYFNDIFRNQSQLLLSRYVKQVISTNFKKNAQISNNILELFSQEDAILENIMDGIAEQLDESIKNDKRAQDLLDATSRIYKNYSAMLTKALTTTKSGKSQTLNNFFDSIIEQLMQIQGYNEDFIDKLITIGKDLTGDNNFQYTPSIGKAVEVLTSTELNRLNSIYSKLASAVNKFEHNGRYLSARSFRSTIKDIMSKDIGESVAGVLLTQAAKNIEKQVDKNIEVAGKSIGLKFESNPNITYQNIGTSVDIENTVSKADLLANKLFKLTLTIDGTQAEFYIDANTSVKNYSSIQEANGKYFRKYYSKKQGKEITTTAKINILSDSTLGRYIGTLGDSPAERYYIYNTFANYPDGEESLRSALAASFFNEWLTGSGKRLQANGVATNDFNNADFLYLNGRIVSMYDIVKKVMQSFQQTGRIDNVGVSIRKNKYKHKKFQDEYGGEQHLIDIGKQRSEIERDLINRFTISSTLNVNFLLT